MPLLTPLGTWLVDVECKAQNDLEDRYLSTKFVLVLAKRLRQSNFGGNVDVFVFTSLMMELVQGLVKHSPHCLISFL